MQTPRVSQPSPLKGISPRDYRKKRMERFGTWIGSKKVGKISLEISFSLPSVFFLSMVIPLDFVHFNFLSSGTSFFGVKNSDWILSIRQIGFNFDILWFNDLSGHFDALLELRDMENIMNGGQLRRKMDSVSNQTTSFDDFKWSDVSGCQFPFYAEALNTSSRRYSQIYEIPYLEL